MSILINVFMFSAKILHTAPLTLMSYCDVEHT